MNSRRRNCLLQVGLAPIVFALFAMGRPAAAQNVRVYTPADSVSVGERFELVVVAERPIWARTVFPAPPSDSTGEVLQAGDLLLLRSILDTSSNDDIESVMDSVIYEATTFALDTAAVGPIPVRLVSGSDTFMVSTTPFLIPVRSVVPSDAEDILDLMPIADFPRPVWPWLVFLGLLIAATAGFLFWYRRSPGIISLIRDEEPTPQSPIDEVMERLDRLDRAHLDTDAAKKAFFVEFSDAIRTYLSRRLQIPALERTSREVVYDLMSLSERNDAPADMIQPVKRLLEVSDLAKFAEIYPGTKECAGSLQTARAVVEDVETFLTPAAEIFAIEAEAIPDPDASREDL